LGECLEEVESTVRELANEICHGRVTQMEALMRICSLCVWLRASRAICKIHEDLVPALQAETCSLCLEDLVVRKKKSLEEFEILENVRRAVKLIEGTSEFSKLIPEIGTNIAMAKANAKTVRDVVGVRGRIHAVSGRPRATGPSEFGGSSHVASAVLTAMKYDRSVRSSINIKFDWAILDICKGMEFKISHYDRTKEPREVKQVDGRTIPWGIARAIKKAGIVPDVVYDLGDTGKEPMLFFFGPTALKVARAIVRIANEYGCRAGK